MDGWFFVIRGAFMYARGLPSLMVCVQIEKLLPFQVMRTNAIHVRD
jgi:hypothetical protein